MEAEQSAAVSCLEAEMCDVKLIQGQSDGRN